MTPYDLSDYHALIRGIREIDRAGGNSTVARLVCADWLQDHGEEERAEYVRLDSQHPGDNSPESYRSAELWARNRDKWFAGIHGTFSQDTFEFVTSTDAPGRLGEDYVAGCLTAGFLSVVRCPLAWWLAHGPDLCRRHPVREVVITGASPGQLYWPQHERYLSHWLRSTSRPDCPACIPHNGLWSILRESPFVVEEDGYRLAFDTGGPALSALNAAALRWAEAEADTPA